jgi:hypothetical protein
MEEPSTASIADITTAGTGIYLHRQKIAEAHTMFAE